jgi:hypothetical protein
MRVNDVQNAIYKTLLQQLYVNTVKIKYISFFLKKRNKWRKQIIFIF